MRPLSEQQLHNLAMNEVGKELEANGFEFLAVNSQLNKDPQFVCTKNKRLYFVIVRVVLYPNNPKTKNEALINLVKEHASKFNATTYYSSVGIANATNYEKPVFENHQYVINYEGLVEV